MNKHLESIVPSSEAAILECASAGSDSTESAVPPKKRGFKPRWLRLQRRERKLREARALSLRPVVG
jgi:hypothetical protein